jgi:hypothetical protein
MSKIPARSPRHGTRSSATGALRKARCASRSAPRTTTSSSTSMSTRSLRRTGRTSERAYRVARPLPLGSLPIAYLGPTPWTVCRHTVRVGFAGCGHSAPGVLADNVPIRNVWDAAIITFVVSNRGRASAPLLFVPRSFSRPAHPEVLRRPLRRLRPPGLATREL